MRLQDILKQQVSFYYDASDATSIITVDIETIFDMIKNGWSVGRNDIKRDINKYTTYIRQIKHAGTKDDYKAAKSKLPMFTGSATFSQRSKNNVSIYNNILILDFDGLQSEQAIQEFKEKLICYSNPQHLIVVWKSPANGLKAAMVHDNTNPLLHSVLVEEIKKNLYPNTPILDMNCKDVTRTCYICYDPDIWISPDYDITPYHFQNAAGVMPIQPTQSSQATRSYGHFQHTAEETAKNVEWQRITLDKTLLNKLHKICDYSNPDYYKDGNRHSEIIRRATLCCKDGVLYENALASLKGKFGPNSKAGMDLKNIESMVNSCYNNARRDFGVDRYEFMNYKK